MREYFVRNVVPLADELGLMGKLAYEDFMLALASKVASETGEEEHKYLLSIIHRRFHEIAAQRDIALFTFALTAMCVEVLREKSQMPDINRLGVIHLEGYLQAMKDARSDTVRRGDNGRRLIGATSREKVRLAALRLNSPISKELAAPDIANAVGLSSARVRKLLGELFPGEAWPPTSK